MNFAQFVERLLAYANDIILIIIGLALIVFLWGLLRYVAAGNDPKKRKEGRDVIMWGIIGLAVMVGVWGFVNIVANVIGDTAGGGNYYAPSGGNIYNPNNSGGFPQNNNGQFPTQPIEGDIPVPDNQFPV
jgi:hypothetical protein